MHARELRSTFLEFFKDHGHVVRPSSSLLPDNDPSVLLTTAGMQQFKPYFLGEKDPQADFGTRRVTTVQKCFRTSDIDSVGDETHLTMFEMLGNFSFGDYWKTEAIDLAWEFLTAKLKLDPQRIWATIFEGDERVPRDTEAETAWKKYLPAERIVALGRKDNFWGPPGTSGSCGPSSEIHWQLNPDSTGKPGDDSNDFVEIWNLVFTEYLQDEDGNLRELSQKNIDTGSGFERLLTVIQKKRHVYETDAFAKIISKVRSLDAFGMTGQPRLDEKRMRIVADHVRGAVFLLADGVRFSNKDQGYILRRIVRRAADQFISSNVLLHPIVETVIEEFGDAYPELRNERLQIAAALDEELQAYQKILALDVGALVRKLRKGTGESEHDPAAGPSHTLLKPEEAFTLYATHGISLDRLERLGFRFERASVEAQIQSHQERSRAGAQKKFGGHGLNDPSSYSDADRAVMTRLHTATHLLHAALRHVLGPEVQQKGSDITPERLRFDFSFGRKLTDEEKQKVETLVNEKVAADLPVTQATMPFQQAMDEGALAFFKDKYGDEVSVYSIGDFSKELCGGPHVTHSAEVGKVKITGEQSVGAGTRRIKAVVAPAS